MSTTEGVYPVPVSLSPSRVNAFTSCPLQFRFVNVQGLPDPPTIHTTIGTIVHRALELLFAHPNDERTVDNAIAAHQSAREEFADHADVTLLELSPQKTEEMWATTEGLVRKYFDMEDPRAVNHHASELRLEHSMGDFSLRGIIDRLERDEHGHLVIVDYKTGRSPHQSQKQQRMNAMMLYAWLCKQEFGEIPSTLRLMYLKDGSVVEEYPTEQTVKFQLTRTNAVWKAISTACTTGNFRPNKSALCGFCSYKKWCPEFGGDPERAESEAPIALGGAE